VCCRSWSTVGAASNLKEFIEYARTNRVNSARGRSAPSAHIFAQALNEKYGLKIEV